MTWHVMLVDDHAVVRAGYRRLLELEPDCVVSAECDDADAGNQHHAAPLFGTRRTGQHRGGNAGQPDNVEHAQDVDQQAAAAKIAPPLLLVPVTPGQGVPGCESRRPRYGAR